MKDGKVVVQGVTKEVLTSENLEKLYGIKFEVAELSGKNRTYIVPYYEC